MIRIQGEDSGQYCPDTPRGDGLDVTDSEGGLQASGKSENCRKSAARNMTKNLTKIR
jgi:hypothetical protein